MFNCCSNKRNYFVLLALMLLLPVFSAFAYNNTFPVAVVDSHNVPVPGATVYAWDRNYPDTNISGVTDAEGKVSLVLSGLTATADNLSNPEPNIGFLVMPNNAANNSRLAFAVANAWFYNLFEADALAPEQMINLNEGCLLHIKPQTVDGNVVTPARLIAGMNIFLPGVPWQVKTIHVAANEISDATPSFDIAWPFETPINIELYGDGKWNDHTARTFYSWFNDSFPVGHDTEKDILVNHQSLKKAQFRVNLTEPDTTGTKLVKRQLHYGENLTIDYSGNEIVYLPVGKYNINFALVNDAPNFYDLGEYGPPPALYPDVDLTNPEDLVEKDYELAGGIGLTVNLQLGDSAGDGEETALGQSNIEIQKKVTLNGFEQWMPVQSNPTTLSSDGTVSSTGASMRFFHRLNDGTYRIRVYKKSYDAFQNLGVIDYSTTPWKCFGYITAPEFEINNASTVGTLTKDINLPQIAAIQANLQIANAPTSGALMWPVVAYLGEYPIYSGSYIWNDDKIFIPFARIDKKIVIRVSYDEDIYDVTNPAAHKVFAPIQGVVGQTIETNLPLDLSNFTNIHAYAWVKQDNGEIATFTGRARLYFSPTVPGSDPVMPGYRAFGSGDWDPGFDNNMIETGNSNMAVFRGEIGASFTLVAKEETPLGLEGIIPYEGNFTVPANHNNLNPFDVNVFLSEDRSFNAIVQVDGAPIGSDKLVGIAVTSIFDDKFKFDDFFFVERKGTITGSNFRVSGIKAGLYDVTLNLDNIDFDAFPYNYGIQTMPIIRREVAVSDDSSTFGASAPVILNLNTGVIGYARGKIVDDLGNGIPGLKIAIHAKGRVEEMNEPCMSDRWYRRGHLAFRCTTDNEGNLISAHPDKPTFIPLEAGEYDIFVEGVATEPTEFKLDLGFTWEAPPIAKISILPNQQVTPVLGRIMRLFPVNGVLTEANAPVKYANFQILNEMGEGKGWGYTNDKGEFQVFVAPGVAQIGLVVEDGPDRRFYLQKFNVVANQANTVTINLDPTTLIKIPMVTRDSAGAVLPQAPGDVFLFSDPEQNFRASHWYLTWSQSDDLGRMNLFVPAFSNEQAGFAYGFRGLEKRTSIEIKDAFGNNNYLNEVYSPGPLQILPVGQTEPVVLTWLKPVTVTINPTNIPAGRENRYLGVLLPRNMFFDGPPRVGGQPDCLSFTTGAQPDRPIFAGLVDGAFRFGNVKPGREYIFISYETFEPLVPETVKWAFEFQWKAMFRHLSDPFLVNADVVRNEAFRALAPLTVNCPQDTALITGPADVKMLFTSDPTNTTGLIGWPLIPGVDTEVFFPVEVPVDYAYRIVYEAQAGSKFLTRAFENVVVPSTGRVFDVILRELNQVSGTFQLSGMPIDGAIILIPEGADATSETFEPIRIPALNGAYQAFLPPGFYNGYAVPASGAPKTISILMEPGVNLTCNINIQPGTSVHGKVVGPVGPDGTTPLPVFDASIAVMRKAEARSDLLDGQDFLPYPAFMGYNEIRCGPTGEFFFEAEDGVDYYIQAIVPVGFTPGAPVKVSLDGTTISVNGVAVDPTQGIAITLGQGGKIAGSLNVPAYIEARPAGQNALLEQFGSINAVYAEARVPNAENRYDFVLFGLDPAQKYDIQIWPAEPGFAAKVLNAVEVPPANAASLSIDLAEGFKVVGQLVDADGNPLAVKDVPVNLAMTLPMEEITNPVAANSRFSFRQNIHVPDPTTYSLQDAYLQGKWTNTNEYGQFVFDNVPQFLVAFIKTESSFSLNNTDYGLARTPNFAPNFGNARLMEVNLTIPVAGKVVGRLIDENGQPVGIGMVEIVSGDNRIYGSVLEDGTFTLNGVAPGGNYMLSIDEVPGRVRVFRMGILVEPGKITDLGSILVAKAVSVTGQIANLDKPVISAFSNGIPEGMGLSVVAFDGNRVVSDEELLRGSFMQHVIGENELFFDPFNPPTNDTPFQLFARFGRAGIGLVLHKEENNGNMSIVTWGWQAGLSIPSQEQVGTGSFELDARIACPSEYGVVEGTLKHSVDTAAVFNRADAVIALYPVEKVGNATAFTLATTPFPTAITYPIDGRWFIRNVPAGTYRIKVITARYGVQFFREVITVSAATPLKRDLALGTSVKKVYGKVVLKGSTTPVTPVQAARVNLFLQQLATTTDANGDFAFFLPAGELFLAQLEIQKPGFRPRRVVEFAGIATDGVKLEADINLGNIELDASVGRFEATLKSLDGGAALIGAEVAMVFKESPEALVWTVGETQMTDETGRVQFSTVPTGKDINFRAKAFYHKPFIYTLPAANNTGVASAVITMEKANPKVFYTGFVSAHETNPDLLNVRGVFDFNQPVYQARLGLKIDETERLGDATPVDLIGGRLTSMRLVNTIPNQPVVVATVSYDTANNGNKVSIGEFEMVGGAVFRREYEVDPLSANGFSANTTDANGNVLPVGLSVPQGYLDPSIENFTITEEIATAGDSLLEGSNNPPEFAGPAFEFNFGGTNFAGGSEHKGLFEIVIKYEEGTSLEPRWYDTVNHRWSKVGIVDGSVQYDVPEKGYVTFKVDHLTKFAVLKNVSGAASGMRCDFNGDGQVGDPDIAAMIARNQLVNAGVADDQITAENVNTVAGDLLKSQTFTVTIVPNTSLDDLNGDVALTDSDLAFLIGWIQLKNAGLTSDQINEAAVNQVSGELLGSSLSGTLSKFPGETVSR